MARGTDRDRPRFPWTEAAFRRKVQRASEPVEWGDIGGTLSDQTDVQAAIDGVDSGGATIRRVLAIGSGTDSVANTEVDVAWSSPAITDSDTTVSGAEVTFTTGGTFAIDVTVRTQSSDRSELIIRTYKDTGSGYAEMTNHIASDYVARNGEQDTGGVTLATMLTVNDGDKLKFSAESDANGTCVLLTAGTILRIVGESAVS